MRNSPILRATGLVEKAIVLLSSIVAWLFAVLLLAILANVALRYLFDRPLTTLSELQWHLYACTAMIGLSYALITDAHVRVDLLYARFSETLRKVVETVSLLLLLIPLCVFLAVHGWEFAETAWRLGESSALPGGLPFRWVVKGIIPFGAAVLLLASLARCVRLWVSSDETGDSSAH
ncbi:MAG: TRAP-type mannitol/chloroaromatic compound transport system permease small subunit [Verrucomicrobiales bacterium]|jgi:TRAP-type mannitol/chloroaromatic compound transport system permease small subunit